MYGARSTEKLSMTNFKTHTHNVLDAKIKKQGMIDFATGTILKVMQSDLDNAESQVQDKGKHLGSFWKLL